MDERMSLVHGLVGCALIGSAYPACGAAQGLGDPMAPARSGPKWATRARRIPVCGA